MSSTAPVPSWPLVLIVDDDADNRAILEIVLVREGLRVALAQNGHEALLAVEHDPPDLILLDLMMPDMSGYQVAAALKGNVATREIPIIMLTAMGDRATRVRALAVGIVEVLTKPVDRLALCGRVRAALRGV